MFSIVPPGRVIVAHPERRASVSVPATLTFANAPHTHASTIRTILTAPHLPAEKDQRLWQILNLTQCQAKSRPKGNNPVSEALLIL